MKNLIIILLVGIIGLMVTIGIILGAGILQSFEYTKEYLISEHFSAVELNTQNAKIEAQAAESEYLIEVYVNAWSGEKLETDELINIAIEDDVLIITEIAPPSNFLGVFAQPYELRLRLFVPEAVYDSIGDSL